MHVVATAGHVDHGKSTLVRALTGMEPDRWAEERRRGMTIDLGYAWTTLPSGTALAFVDVPGHERFIGNMLAGLGPAPAVLFVVAADEGWRRQSAEHLAAVDALGVRHGAARRHPQRPGRPRPGARRGAASACGRRACGDVEAVARQRARPGAGLDDLRGALDRLVAGAAARRDAAPVRLWVDRSFTMRGAGTVVTGTLGAGTLAAGRRAAARRHRRRVRGLQSLERPRDEVPAVARVAVNLRGVERSRRSRGDALLTPGAWRLTASVDVRLWADPRTCRPSCSTSARRRWRRRTAARGRDGAAAAAPPLPLRAGDRALLRDPGAQPVAAGVLVLDADPPALRRRGAAAGRAADLAAATGRPDLARRSRGEGRSGGPTSPRSGRRRSTTCPRYAWRGVAGRRGLLAAWAVLARAPSTPTPRPRRWSGADRRGRPPRSTCRTGLLAPPVSGRWARGRGRRTRPAGERADLGPAAGVAQRSRSGCGSGPSPRRNAGPDALRLGARELAAAERAGRLLRLRDDVVLLPDGPARAMRVLARLEQPFTQRRPPGPRHDATGGRAPARAPRQPGWTRRPDGSHREVRR